MYSHLRYAWSLTISQKDLQLKKYLPIIRDKPVYPIIYDANRTVLSMPPIINSNHSKITLNTTDVFIDITATDKTKLEIVSQILVAMFSPYCSEPYTIEPVRIISPHNNETRESPDLMPRPSQASAKFINSVCGLELSREEICKMLSKMCYTAKPSATEEDKIDVDIPITRADVLHQADIIASQLPVDFQLRRCCASYQQAGRYCARGVRHGWLE
jgi:phenylalanyl-tRNA synthetase beta chain